LSSVQDSIHETMKLYPTLAVGASCRVTKKASELSGGLTWPGLLLLADGKAWAK
jgi:hypothetical protein